MPDLRHYHAALETKRVECTSRDVRGVNVLLESLEHFGGRLIRERKARMLWGLTPTLMRCKISQ